MMRGECLARGRQTNTFTRHKFLEALCEAGPQAMFMVYVMYAKHHRYNFYLTLSIVSSIGSLAAGITVWISYTASRQFARQHMSIEITIHHQILWFCYFFTDFALRVLTFGLFVSIEELQPYNTLLFVVLAMCYVLVTTVVVESRTSKIDRTRHRNRIGTWRSIFHAVVLTFLTNVLPADVRVEAISEAERRIFFTVPPEIRKVLVRVMTPFRLMDFICLGSMSLWMHFDWWQFYSFVSLLVATSVTLFFVLTLEKPRAVIKDSALDGTQSFPVDCHKTCQTNV